jgi:ankyrin repeat protein
MATASKQPDSTTTTSQKPDPESLPPEALDLATRLFDFSRSGQTSQILPYLSAGLPPNLTNSSGNTLLMLAAYNGHSGTVSMLLQKGADPNVLNDRGQSPLAGAVFKGYDEVVKVLVEEGKADVRLGQPNAVDCARMFKRWEALRVMGVGDGGET